MQQVHTHGNGSDQTVCELESEVKFGHIILIICIFIGMHLVRYMDMYHRIIEYS